MKTHQILKQIGMQPEKYFRNKRSLPDIARKQLKAYLLSIIKSGKKFPRHLNLNGKPGIS